MSKAIVLNENLENSGELALPESYQGINSHNLYLSVKSYLASFRANTAITKTRSEVRGGGKKPWNQKGRGGARAGSTRSPIWVGGGVAMGPRNNRNYNQKINKKQIKLALKYAINYKAENGALFVVDKVNIDSGKTKDAANFISKLNQRDVLIVTNEMNEKTFLAFRNLKNAFLIDETELNAYEVSAFHSVVFEKSVFENLTKES